MPRRAEREHVKSISDSVYFEMVDRDAEKPPIKCVIRDHALRQLDRRLTFTEADLLRVFREHQSTIENVANKKIDLGQVDPDGIVWLSDFDFA